MKENGMYQIYQSNECLKYGDHSKWKLSEFVKELGAQNVMLLQQINRGDGHFKDMPFETIYCIAVRFNLELSDTSKQKFFLHNIYGTDNVSENMFDEKGVVKSPDKFDLDDGKFLFTHWYNDIDIYPVFPSEGSGKDGCFVVETWARTEEVSNKNGKVRGILNIKGKDVGVGWCSNITQYNTKNVQMRDPEEHHFLFLCEKGRGDIAYDTEYNILTDDYELLWNGWIACKDIGIFNDGIAQILDSKMRWGWIDWRKFIISHRGMDKPETTDGKKTVERIDFYRNGKCMSNMEVLKHFNEREGGLYEAIP